MAEHEHRGGRPDPDKLSAELTAYERAFVASDTRRARTLSSRWAEDRYDRLPELAAELVKLNVDVLVTHGTPGALATNQATSTVPIVMAAVGERPHLGMRPVRAALRSEVYRF